MYPTVQEDANLYLDHITLSNNELQMLLDGIQRDNHTNQQQPHHTNGNHTNQKHHIYTQQSTGQATP